MNKIIKKVLSVVTALTVFVFLAGPVQGQTIAELQAQINALLAQLATLQTQLAALTGAPTGAPAACAGVTFTRNLSQGMTGSDVKCLQALLNLSSDTQVAATGSGSPGNETTYFGSLTKAAVIKFQEKYAADILTPIGLTAGTGFVGAKTIAKLNTLKGGVVPPPTGVGLSVTLAADTPAAARIISGEAKRDFLKLVFTAGSSNVTITELNLKRAGYSGDSDISTAYLYEGETLLRSSASISTGKIRFAAANLLTITAGTSKTITVKVDVAAGILSGETIKLGIESASDITATGQVSGTFPIFGNEMTAVAVTDLATLAVGTVGSGPSTVDAGKTNQTIFSASLTAGFSNVSVRKIKFTNLGTTAADALTNLKLLVDGVQRGTIFTSLDANNTLTFDFSANPILVTTAASVSLTLKADVIKGSGRTFRLTIDSTADVVAVDTNYNVGITATGVPTTGTTATSINPGVLGALPALDTPSGNVVLKALGVPLVKYDFGSVGEDVKVSKLKFDVTFATGTVAATTTYGMTNFKLFFDGNWYGAPVNVSCTPSGATGPSSQRCTATLEFTNLEFTTPAGLVKSLIVKADVATTTAGTNLFSGNTVKVGLQTAAGGYANAKRLEAGTYFDFPGTAVPTGSLLTVVTGTLNAYSNLPAALTFSGEAVNAKISSFIVQPTVTEIARIEQVRVTLAGTVSSSEMLDLKTSWSDEVLADVNPLGNNDFVISPALELNPNEQRTLDIYLTFYYAVLNETTTVTVTITGKGKTSGAALTTGAITGSTVTIKTPSLTPAFANTPLTAIVLAGQSGVKLADYKFDTLYKDYYVDQIMLQSATGLIKEAWLKYPGSTGSTLESSKLALPANVEQTFDLTATGDFFIPKDSSKTLEVYATFRSIPGETATTSSGLSPQIILTKYREKGQLATDIVDINASAMEFRRTKITVTATGGAADAVRSATQEVMRFNVGADAAYQAKVESVTTTVTGSATTSASGVTLTLVRVADGLTVATTTLIKTTGASAIAGFPAASLTAYAQNLIPSGTSYDYRILMNTNDILANTNLRFTILAATDVIWHDGATGSISSTRIKTFPAEGVLWTYK